MKPVVLGKLNFTLNNDDDDDGGGGGGGDSCDGGETYRQSSIGMFHLHCIAVSTQLDVCHKFILLAQFCVLFS